MTTTVFAGSDADSNQRHAVSSGSSVTGGDGQARASLTLHEQHVTTAARAQSSGLRRRTRGSRGRCGGQGTTMTSWRPFLALLLVLASNAPSAVLSQQQQPPPPPTALAPAPDRAPGGAVTIGSFVPTSVLAGSYIVTNAGLCLTVSCGTKSCIELMTSVSTLSRVNIELLNSEMYMVVHLLLRTTPGHAFGQDHCL